MSKIKYIREGKGLCNSCARERDLVVPVVPRVITAGTSHAGRFLEQRLDIVVSRHLPWIEEYTPRGARPNGFCPGSFQPPTERIETKSKRRATRAK